MLNKENNSLFMGNSYSSTSKIEEYIEICNSFFNLNEVKF